MIKSNIHIEIVRSSEPRLSSMSLESCEAIVAVLAKHYSKVGVSTVNNISDLNQLVALKPDLVFMGMKFVPTNQALGLDDPDKIWLAEYLDRHDIAYTGSNKLAHKLELNKGLAKQRVIEAGLDTSSFQFVKQGMTVDWDGSGLDFPVFVKPSNRGGGQGIDKFSVANNHCQLNAKIDSIASVQQSDSLVENYLSGREFSVAILKNSDFAGYDVMPIEIVADIDSQGIRMLGGDVKAANQEVVSVVTDEILKSKINALALGVFKAIGARDYGRIDIRLDGAGTPHFLEANLIPSLISGYGSFPKSCLLNAGLDYEPMIINIVELGLCRNINTTEASSGLKLGQSAGLVFEPAL